MTEPGTLIPLVLGATQVVLVGDHKQLGPCVSSLAEDQGLATSLFERLLQSGLPSHMLNVQYRMHPDIASWPSKRYYDGKLGNGSNTLHLPGAAVISGPALCLYILLEMLLLHVCSSPRLCMICGFAVSEPFLIHASVMQGPMCSDVAWLAQACFSCTCLHTQGCIDGCTIHQGRNTRP